MLNSSQGNQIIQELTKSKLLIFTYSACMEIVVFCKLYEKYNIEITVKFEIACQEAKS